MSVLAETPASPKSGGAAFALSRQAGRHVHGRPDATFTARSWSRCDRARVKKGKLAGLHRRSGRKGGGAFVIQGGSSAGRLTARRNWFQSARYGQRPRHGRPRGARAAIVPRTATRPSAAAEKGKAMILPGSPPA
jgi:hypothetical protein